MKQIDHYIKIKKTELSFISVYLEAFEGMCAIRTPNPKPGDDTVVHMMVSPDFEVEYKEIMNDLRSEVPWEEVEL
jgi:hypothetical protein